MIRYNAPDGKIIEIAPLSGDGGVEIYMLPFDGKYEWREELKDVCSTWSPLCWRDHSLRQWWFPNQSGSAYQFGAPLMAVLDAESVNKTTVALSDSVLRSRITVSVADLDQTDEIIWTVTVEEGGIRQDKDRKVLMRIDRRRIDYNDTVYDAGAWMRSFLSHIIRVPDNAKLPLYSSWYNFHQEPEQYLLEKELEAAAKIGFKTFILDDGWQFEGNNTGDYDKCGDWHVAADKFPDFRSFCDKVHSYGMKMLLWFPVPFAGFDSEDYKRYKDKMAFERPDFRAGVLDVRYPEIREYITGIYKRMQRDYGIDGLKLDFIDAFKADPSQIAPYKPGMDIENLDEAVRVLMDEIYDGMTALDPDFLFEFRQNYIGAEIVNHCNMLRVADCAADSVTNRIGIAALRLVNAETAIHSDMLLWGHEESPLNCQRQLLNIMFSVPQISVRLTEIPQEQLLVVQNFVKYWTENRSTLLYGKFRAANPDANYTYMSAEGPDKKITALYSTAAFEPCGKDEDVFNNTSKDYIICEGGRPFDYVIYDLFGAVISKGASDGRPDRFGVPRGGMLRTTVK